MSSLDAAIHRNGHSFILCHAILSTVNREYRWMGTKRADMCEISLIFQLGWQWWYKRGACTTRIVSCTGWQISSRRRLSPSLPSPRVNTLEDDPSIGVEIVSPIPWRFIFLRRDQINHVILQLVREAREKISSIETVPYLIPLSFRSKIRIFRVDDVRRFFKKKEKKKKLGSYHVIVLHKRTKLS